MRSWFHRHPTIALLGCLLLSTLTYWSWSRDGHPLDAGGLFSLAAWISWGVWALVWWDRS